MSPILQREKPGKSNRRWLHYLTLRRNKCFCFFLGLVVLIVNFKQNGIPIPDDARPPIAAAARAKELVDEQEIIAKEEQQLNDPKDARVTSSRAREISEIKKMAKEEQLNVIIFYPDDWRHDDLGGVSPILKTPFFHSSSQGRHTLHSEYGHNFHLLDFPYHLIHWTVCQQTWFYKTFQT